jgi:hypothetical protein
MTTPTPVRTYSKDPDASLDYGFDWSEWLASGDTIATSTWISTPVGLTIYDTAFGDDATLCWISGGTDGTTYLVTNRITTLDGRIEDRTFELVVAQR